MQGCGYVVCTLKFFHYLDKSNTHCRIVEYATRDEAQTAINTLSNRNLMGRLVYVREVGR